jgi:hypothetical protein
MAERYVVRKDIVEPHNGERVVRWLTKWTADNQREWFTSSWTSLASCATSWDRRGAEFAATIAGGKVVKRVKRRASPAGGDGNG